jgi:intracellular septation protein A
VSVRIGPSFRTLLFGSGPRFMRDAFGATVVFYVGWKLHGLLLGVVAATVWTVTVYVWERRHARPGIAARIGLAIALLQAGAALASQSVIGYFAPPVIINAVYGLAFLVSVVIGKPLAAVFAMEAYPFPAEIRALPGVRRAFAHISLVWGFYLLFRSVFRLVVLLNFSVDVYVAVNVATAGPMLAGLMAWSFWYGLRGIRRAVTESLAVSSTP